MSKLEKFEKLCNVFSKGITKYDYVLLLITLLIGAIGVDLNLEYVRAVAGMSLFMFISWYLFTYVCLLVLACIKKYRSKKANIEKLIEEEERKE